MLPLVLRYLKTIGFDLKNAAITLDVVSEIMYKHGLTFATTSLPANLQDDVQLNFANLAEYLLRNRYGYCFHHNVTAYEVFKQLGFDVQLLVGHVRKPPTFTETNKLPTHVIILLTLNGKRYLLDPSWGLTSLKPQLLDAENTQQQGYHVTKLSQDKYGLVDHAKCVRYEFNTTPVNLCDLKLSLDNVMSKDHVFYQMFFFQQKKPNGDVNYLFGRKHLCVDEKGQRVKEKEFTLHQPVKSILGTHFAIDAKDAARLSRDTYPNPAIKKVINEFMPAKVYQNIYRFLSVTDQHHARQTGKEWHEASIVLKASI